MKTCDIQIQGNRCYYKLSGCSNEELMDIINYKSWTFNSWKTGKEQKYFTFMYVNRPDEKVVWSSIGFSPILIRYLQGFNYLINGKEVFKAKNISIGKTLFQPYDFQSESRDAWIKNGCFGIITIPTGGGKSFEACDIISKMKTKTLISVHTNDLLINAWLNTLIEQFGENIKSQIGIIGGKLTKNDRKRLRLISDTGFDANINKDIVIATAQSSINHLDKLSNERFGLCIFDEVHHYASEQFSKVASHIRAPYRLGLTATIWRPDGTSPLFFGLLGDVVYKIGIRELIGKGILVEPVFSTIVINDTQAMRDIATCGKIKLDLSRYVKQKSASSVIKKNYILQLAKSLSLNKKKFIMYTDFVNEYSKRIVQEKNVKRVEVIKNDAFVRDFYVKELNNIGIKVIGISSDMGGIERQKVFSLLENNKLDGLIFGRLGSEGVNIPKVDSVIMNNASKSTILFPQRVGRAMRIVKGDSSKKNAFIYEVILNTPMENKWSDINFYEYEIEGYVKHRTYK